MKEEVGYAGEAPSLPSWAEGDWRYQEMAGMGPQVVMDELLTLAEAIHGSRLEWEEAKSELRQAQERLKLMKVQVLQAATESSDPKIAAQVAGKNVEVRKRKADVYLADHLTVKQLMFEIKPLEAAESTTRLAMEALLDRQKNLHQWARMFEAQVKLLSTVRMPEPGIIDLRSQPDWTLEEIGRVLAKGYREPVLTEFDVEERLFFVGEGKDPFSVICKDDAEKMAQRAIAAKGGYFEVREATYLAHRAAWEATVLAELDGVPVTIEREPAFDGFIPPLYSPDSDVRVIFDFVKTPESSVVYEDAQRWMEWYADPVGSPPVDTVELIERIVKVQKSSEEDVLAGMTAGGISVETSDEKIILDYARAPGPAVSTVYTYAQEWASWFDDGMLGKPPIAALELARLIRRVQETVLIEGVAAGKASVDELFPPDIQIPPSLNVPEEDVDALKAAMERHTDEPFGPTF